MANPPPDPAPAESTPDPPPDYARGVFVASKPGPEFTGAGASGTLANLALSQGLFAVMGAVFVIMMLLRPVFNLSVGHVVLIAVLTLIATIALTVRLTGWRTSGHDFASAAFSSSTDTRYRVRVVLPKKRASRTTMRWLAAIEGDDDTPAEHDLAYTSGGFEPAIARLWLGVRRNDRRYGLTIAVAAVALAVVIWTVARTAGPGAAATSSALGFMGYAAVALVLAGSVLTAELCWPIYARVVPGRLDIFRYRLLGLGTPDVRSIDLTETPLCLDFGTYTLAIEPPRPPGEPAPDLVLSKRWPYNKTHPPGHDVEYMTFLLTPGRAHLAKRIVQAARSTEPAPPLPMDRLLG